jgi:hypothetical protein
MMRLKTLGKAGFFTAVITMTVFAIFYTICIHSINEEYSREYQLRDGVALRRFPFPYQAAMAICSDIDETRSAEMFLEIQRFLSTKEETSMGRGVGLEVGNSFFMYDRENRFSYFSGRGLDQETIDLYLSSGFIDALHSYGSKKDFSREDARRAITELHRLEKKIDVWSNHSNDVDNLGGDAGAMGDEKTSTAFHADLTVGYGFKYFWLGRLTSVPAVETEIRLKTFLDIFDGDYPLVSSLTMFKEFAKHVLGVFGDEKYSMHGDYRLSRVRTLRDGQRVFEFIRSDGFWEGVGTGANSKDLAYSLSHRNLENLKSAHGYSIIYTHLGKNSDCEEVICKETQEALRNLAMEFESGNIYVTTTSKLLTYYVVRRYLKWDVETAPGSTRIRISGVYDPLSGKDFLPDCNQLQGITFYVQDPENTVVLLGGEEVGKMQNNPEDFTGRKSIMFPLHYNELPKTH